MLNFKIRFLLGIIQLAFGFQPVIQRSFFNTDTCIWILANNSTSSTQVVFIYFVYSSGFLDMYLFKKKRYTQ